jgi:uncharacterized membrane protein YcaP (DUF421 family)
MEIFGFDIERAFTPDVSLFEIFVRGSIIYLIIFLLLRVVLRRKSGNVAFTDLLVLVLVADAAQNAMAAEYHSLTDGLFLVGTLVFWAYALDWLGFHFPRIQRYVYPAKKALITHGRLVQPALREELMTIEELMTQLRLNGTDKVEDVRAAYMEGNGQVSVLKREGAGGDSGKPNQAASIGGLG